MSGWQPIETAPRDVQALFWIRPTTKEDGDYYVDTDGNPILVFGSQPRIVMEKYGGWSSLMRATHWMPLPSPPQPSGDA